jgi:hypothetical protein
VRQQRVFLELFECLGRIIVIHGDPPESQAVCGVPLLAVILRKSAAGHLSRRGQNHAAVARTGTNS